MADSSILSSILSGNDPLAPQMVPAYIAAQQTQQMLDPNYGMNQGPFGALARVLAGATGYGQGGLQSAVQNVTNQRTAALPELAKLYATDDPYKEAGANTGAYSNVALAQLLAGANPENVAKARLYGAQAAQAGLNLGGFKGIQALAGAGQPVTAAPMPGKNAGAAMPATQPAFPQDYTGRPQSEPDIAAIATMPPALLPQALARMTPAAKAALAAKIAQLRGGTNAAVRP